VGDRDVIEDGRLRSIGVRRLRVMGTPRNFVGLAGFGLEVVEYV